MISYCEKNPCNDLSCTRLHRHLSVRDKVRPLPSLAVVSERKAVFETVDGCLTKAPKVPCEHGLYTQSFITSEILCISKRLEAIRFEVQMLETRELALLRQRNYIERPIEEPKWKQSHIAVPCRWCGRKTSWRAPEGWAAHHNDHCKEKHVRVLKDTEGISDELWSSLINLLEE